MAWSPLDPSDCGGLATVPDFARLDAHAVWACVRHHRGYRRPTDGRLPVFLELVPGISLLERWRIARLIDVPGVYARCTDQFWTGWLDEAKLPLLCARPGVARWRFGMPQTLQTNP